MHIKNLKYLLSLIVSLYLMNKISKEIYINLSQLKILKDEINIFILILIVFFTNFLFSFT